MKDSLDPEAASCCLQHPSSPCPFPIPFSYPRPLQCCSLLMSLFAQDVFPSTSPKERFKGSWSTHISKAQGNIYSPEHLLWMQHPVQALPVLSGSFLCPQKDEQWAESWMDQRKNPTKGS